MGANPHPHVAGLEELPGKVNYLLGNDATKWHTNIPTYAKVQYQGVYPGVDLVYYSQQEQLEYDFVVAPEVDPQVIRLAFADLGGAELNPAPTIATNGDLILQTAGGELHLHKPLVYQEADGVRQEIAGGYVLLSEPQDSGLQTRDSGLQPPQVGFAVAAYDPHKPLVIDPGLSYSTYLGGNDVGFGIAVDPAGNAYVTGQTASTHFPTVNPLQPAFGGGPDDAFVAKLNASGSALVYSTYL